MNAEPDKLKGIITLKSVNDEEEAMLRALILKENGLQLVYDGREGANCDDPLNKRMLLHFRFFSKLYIIVATNDDNEHGIRLMRDALFFSSGVLTLVDWEEKEGKIQVKVCIAFCKQCNAPLIIRGRCEWKICEACVAKCEHEYQEGHVHGGNAGVLGVGMFCAKCGQGKPGEIPRVILRRGERAFVEL